jgi:hypothetical protein
MELKASESGFARASANSSLAVETGTEGFTIRMLSSVPKLITGAKSRIGSNGSFVRASGAIEKPPLLETQKV